MLLGFLESVIFRFPKSENLFSLPPFYAKASRVATEGFTLPVEFLGLHVAATLRRGFEPFRDVADGFLNQPVRLAGSDLLGEQIIALAIVQLGRFDQDVKGSGERLNTLLVVHV